jgi:hypothetical protein
MKVGGKVNIIINTKTFTGTIQRIDTQTADVLTDFGYTCNIPLGELEDLSSKVTFPTFWYDSNATWGNVNSLNDLREKLQLQLAENNSINTIDDFLDKSVQASDGGLNFGTRREHTGSLSLRVFLAENNLIDDFLLLAQND